MARKDEFKGVNLKGYEERLLNDPNVGEALQRGERVRAEDLPMDIKREMGLDRNQYVNFKPDVLAALGMGQVVQGGRGRKRFVPTPQQIESANIEPIGSIQDVINTVTRRITPPVMGTAGDIETSAGKGVRQKIPQRNIQEIPMREPETTSILDMLRNMGQSISKVPSEYTGVSLMQQLANEAQYQSQTGMEKLQRFLQNQLVKPRPASNEQTLLSAIRGTTGLPARESQGAVVQVGNKKYRMDQAGRIVQIIEPTK